MFDPQIVLEPRKIYKVKIQNSGQFGEGGFVLLLCANCGVAKS